jgi:predicted RNase H-like HicB family nuclease
MVTTMRTEPYVVHAMWDAEACVWVAESDDVPGLVTGADTLEELIEKLRVLVPEMLEANGVLPAEAAAVARFKVVAERTEQPRAVA